MLKQNRLNSRLVPSKILGFGKNPDNKSSRDKELTLGPNYEIQSVPLQISEQSLLS